MLSIISEIVTLSAELGFLLDYANKRDLLYNLFRSLVSLPMLFIILSFLFDMFKWATFLVSASLKTTYLNAYEEENLLVRRNKQLKLSLYSI